MLRWLMLRWRGGGQGRKGPLFEKSGAKTFATFSPGLRATSRDDVDILML
jgi:hypothetical protein